jgi:hypothetical protein
VATVSLPELEAIAAGFAKDRFDEGSARSLGRAYEEFVSRRRRPVGGFRVVADGKEFPTFYAALADPGARFEDVEIRLEEPAPPGPGWDYLVPFERIVFRADGSADLHPPKGGASRRAIARVLLREHFLPRSRAEEDRSATEGEASPLPRLIGTLQQGVSVCRAIPALPLEVAILLYLAEERTRFELDLIHTTLVGDPRAGRLSASRRVVRTSRMSWGLDHTLGRGHVSLLATRCLEVLVESNGLSSVELAHVFGGVRELADSALQGLVQQRLATFDRRTGVYRARLEAFLPAEGATVEDEAPLGTTDPALHMSVKELIDAADARASCPLCGKPIAPGPSSLLCAECAAKVGLA